MPTQLAAPARLYCLKSSEGTKSVAFTAMRSATTWVRTVLAYVSEINATTN
jgi:hypothetical protein